MIAFAEVSCQTWATCLVVKFARLIVAAAPAVKDLLITMTVSAPSFERIAANDDRLSGSGTAVRDADVAKGRLVAVVVAIHLHRFVGRRRRIRRGPTRRHVQTFAAKDAKDIGLRCGPVDEAFGAPVVFSDTDLQARDNTG